MRVANAHPGDRAERGHQVHEPAEHPRTAGRDVEEHKGTERRAQEEGRVWHTHAVDPREDFRGLALDSETV